MKNKGSVARGAGALGLGIVLGAALAATAPPGARAEQPTPSATSLANAIPVPAGPLTHLPGVAGAGRSIDASNAGPSIAERFATIRQRVHEVLVYPPIARARGVAGKSQIEFAINSEGRPVDIRTLQSSGSPILDRAAARAIRDAAPLPWLYGRIIVPVHFELRNDG